MTDFLVVDAPSAYNAILGRSTLNKIGAIILPSYFKLKFHTNEGVGEERGHQQTARDCYLVSLKGKAAWVHQVETQRKDDLRPQPPRSVAIHPSREFTPNLKKKTESGAQLEPADEIEQIDIGEGKTLNIDKATQGEGREQLIGFLREQRSVFAWTIDDIPGIPRAIVEYKLHVKVKAKPVRQNKRSIRVERQKAVRIEVDKLIKADFVREVTCPVWISNTVLVKKIQWRLAYVYRFHGPQQSMPNGLFSLVEN